MKLRAIRYPSGKLYAIKFWCPGCRETHQFKVDAPNHWDFNGDYDSPTFSPSLRVFDRYQAYDKGVWATQCHLFVQQGKIVYCDDANHTLKGQTIDLPDLPPAEDHDS